MIQLAALTGLTGSVLGGASGSATPNAAETAGFASFLSDGLQGAIGFPSETPPLPAANAAVPGAAPVIDAAAATGKTVPPAGKMLPVVAGIAAAAGPKSVQLMGANLTPSEATAGEGKPARRAAAARPAAQALSAAAAGKTACAAEVRMKAARAALEDPAVEQGAGLLAVQAVPLPQPHAEAQITALERAPVAQPAADTGTLPDPDRAKPLHPDHQRHPAAHPAIPAVPVARSRMSPAETAADGQSVQGAAGTAREFSLVGAQAALPASLAAAVRETADEPRAGAITVRAAAFATDEGRALRGRPSAQPAEAAPAAAGLYTPADVVAASDAVPVSTATPQAGAPRDFAALVDRLMAAREAAAEPRGVELSVQHAEFGEVSLRFEQGERGLSVSLASPDPEFARAVEAASAASPGTADTGARDGSTASPSGQGLSGRGDNGFAQSGGRPANHAPEPASGRDHSARVSDDDAEAPPSSPRADQPRRGILA